MKYFSKKDKIQEFIRERVIPAVKIKDLDYEKVVEEIQKKTLSERKMIEEVIGSFVPKEMKEIRILTIPDEEINDWLSAIVKNEKETEEIIGRKNEQQ
jgi:hypothetical protein